MTRADLKVASITLALAASAVLLHLFVARDVPMVVHIDWIDWWMLAVVFYVVERNSVYLEWRDHTVTYALVDLPILIGLASMGVTEVIMAAVVAQITYQLTARSLPMKKILFNVAMVYFELAVLASVLGLLFGGIDVTTPAVWPVLILVLAATSLTANVLVGINIWLSGGDGRRLLDGRILATDTTALVISTTFAIVAVLAIIHHPFSAILVGGLTVVLIGAYRKHRKATDRYESMKLLARQMDEAATGDGSTVWADLLQRVTGMLGAGYAELCIFDTDEGGSARRHYTGPGGALEVRIASGAPALRRRRRLAETGQSRVLTATEIPLDIPEEKRARGAVASPLVVSDHVVGLLLVADRATEAGPFSDERAEELGFYAARIGQAVAQGKLLERLRDDLDDLQRQKYTDALTGLPTESAFYETMRDATLRKAAFAVVGIANLAEINRAFGREAGDLVVRKVAGMVAGSDAVAAPAYRFPGAKLAVAMHGAGADELLGLVRRRLGGAAQPIRIHETNVLVDVYCGIAVYPGDGSEVNEVLEAATLAMSRGEKDHQRFSVYQASVVDHQMPAALLKGDLAAAIRDGTIDVYLQPKMQLHDASLAGVEVLARWKHPQHGFIRPDIFVGIAEETGLIHELTMLIMRKALTVAGARRLDGEVMDVAINLSAYDFRHDDFPAVVAGLLDEYGIPPGKVTFEITESILMGDVAQSVEMTRKLHEIGVRISVDDFGTGYSSLAYLARLPLDELKIDRAFIVKMDEREIDATIVETLIDLGHKLGMEVVAEGVESGGVIRMLTDMHCDQIQGYFFARPMDEVSLTAWLAGRPGRNG